MATGPRSRPNPLIVHVDDSGKPVKFAESNSIYVTNLSSVNINAGTLTANKFVGISPENGVYFRGKVTSNIIDLPDYWTNLVHNDSLTVNLTPIGHNQPNLKILNIENNKVYLESDQDINAFYIIYGTRKDVPNLQVEI